MDSELGVQDDTITLCLTYCQADYLKDILDWWIDDTKDATDAVETDPELDTFEALLDAALSIRKMYSDAVEIRHNIWELMNGRDPAATRFA